MFADYINTYFKRMASYIIALLLGLLSVLPTTVLYTKTVSNNKAIAESMKATGYIAFELLNEIINVSSNLVSENKDFFLKKEHNETEYIEMSNKILEIKNNCPYLERIVFYKKGDSRLLTDNGTIHSEEFFSTEYKNEKYNVEFWEKLLESYQTPTVVPSARYETTDGMQIGSSKCFVIPNIYYVYNVGVLFFVDEEKFIDYCGFNVNKNSRVSFYNLNGEYVFGNGNGKPLNTDRIENESYERMSFWGNYEMANWFKYNDMIFQVKISNPVIPLVLLISLFGNIVVILIVLEIIRRRRVNIALVTDSGIDIRTMLYACMNNSELLKENESILNQLITVKSDSRFALYALVFSNVTDKRSVPSVKEANKKLPNTVMAIEKIGNVIIIFASIPLSKHEIADKFVESEVSVLVDSSYAVGNVKLVKGMDFSEFSELSTAYSALRHNFLMYTDANAGSIGTTELEKIKREISQYIAEGNFSTFIERLRSEIAVAQNSMPYSMYVYYLVYVYFFVAEMLERKNEFISDTFILLAEGIKANEFNFNSEAMTNLVLNILVNAKQYSEAKPENTEKTREILDYINKNYKKDIGLDEIAERFGMKAKSFSTFFKRKMGVGFLEYLSRLRMDEAKRLLTETDKSVKEILEEVGYISNSTFTMTFKKYVGKSPLQFRNDNRDK